MTDNNSVKEDAKDPRSVEAHRDPDELLRGLNSEDQGEGNGADPNQEFHDLGQLAVQYEKNGRNENGGNGEDKGSQDENASKGKSSKNKRNFMAYKYSNRKKGDLHEAVILSGKPAFLRCENGLIKAVDRIEEDIRIINPPYVENYPYEPYEFKDMDEVLIYVERARNETIDSLYLQAKQIAFDYNDQKQEKLILLAIETVWSYLQDKFPTTHYDIVLGGNGCGKSSYGNTFGAVGYRVVNLTDPNAANINRILGCVEIGQCTIVSDETGAIDKHPDLMSILKTGYESKGKTSKINDYTRQPEFYSTYCFKMIIAERMPNLRDARGVHDRSFTFTTYKGRPKYDIKETLEPQGNAGRQERLDRLNDFRKLMLIYRLLHFKDEVQDISVNVEGREKELSKPVIQLFYGSKVQKEIEATLQTFLDARNEKKEITLEPITHSIITALIDEFGTEISVKQIWERMKSTIQGHSDEKKPNEYHTLEYGTIYNNTISSILEQTFGGRPRHRRDGNVFLFDLVELARVGKGLNLSTDIQTKLCEGCEGSEASIAQAYQFGEHRDSNLRGEVEGNLINNNQKEGYTDPQKPSQPSQPSQAGLDTSNKEDGPLKLIHSPAAQVLTNDDLDTEDEGIRNTRGESL